MVDITGQDKKKVRKAIQIDNKLGRELFLTTELDDLSLRTPADGSGQVYGGSGLTSAW